MSTEVCAYNYQFVEMRFHRINFDLPSYDGIEGNGGDLHIETNLRFGVDSNSLYCTVSAQIILTPEGQESVDDDEKVKVDIEIAGTARFHIGNDHGITNKKLNQLEQKEVISFSNVIDPLIVSKAKEILINAGIDGVAIPLQLKPIRN